MMQPWPFISRGTEWLVPIVPGLVRLIVVPWKSADRELVVAGLADDVLVGRPERREVHRLGGLDRRHQQLAGAVGLRQVDREAEVDVGRADEVRLAVDDVEAVVHLRHRLERLDQRVADEVGERHLAAAGAGEVVVDDDAVVDQQLDRDRADAGRGRHGEAGVHVLRGAGGRAAQHASGSARRWPRLAAGVSGSFGTGEAVRRRGRSARRRAGLRVTVVGLATGFAGAGRARSSPRSSPRASRRPPASARRRLRGLALAAGFALAVVTGRASTAAARCCRCARPARCSLKKSHHTLSTLFGSCWYARTSRRRATRWRRTRRGGRRQRSLSTGDAPCRRLGHGLDRLFR